MARQRNPARLVIALSVAAALAVFLLYASVAGGGTPTLAPSELGNRADVVSLGGRVVGPVRGDAHAGGLFFRLRDISGNAPAIVRVRYTGSVPDLFRVGRDIVVEGRLQGKTFVATPGSLITKCPSKYAPEKPAS